MKRSVFALIMSCLLIMVIFASCSNRGDPVEDARENSTVDLIESSPQAESRNDSAATGSSDKNAQVDEGKKNSVSDEDSNNPIESDKSDDSNTDSVTIVFLDDDGNVMKTENIEKGEDATPPDDPEKEGYKFEGWNYDYDNVQTDLTITPNFKEITEPTLVVKNVTAKPGDKIDVSVSVYNNPGFLSMLVNIQYDESVLTLTDVTNGALMGDYMFTPPKNMKNDCNAAWNINDIPQESENGEVMVLHFKLSKNATGKYPISVSCLSNAFDDSYEAFSFESISGSVTVK